MKPNIIFFTNPLIQHTKRIYENYYQSLFLNLKYFFNLTVVDRDCDFTQELDKNCPDIILFDGGQDIIEKPINIKNLRGNQHIPKIGLIQVDSHHPSKFRTLKQFDEYDIKTYFAIDTSIGQAMPEINERLYYLPWHVDSSIYRNYNLSKQYEISMLGSGFFENQSRYPWRARVREQIIAQFPSIQSPRPSDSNHSVSGTNYARLLNQSKISLGCGGIKKILVRKLLEIPACNSCLCTEETEIIREAGFIDGENCIFINESNARDKISHLLNDSERQRVISKNGFKLVHSKHLHIHRNQIFSWYKLNKKGVEEKCIVQSNPFSELTYSESKTSTFNRGDNIYELSKRDAFNNLFKFNIHKSKKLLEELNQVYGYDTSVHWGIVLTKICTGHDENEIFNDIYLIKSIYDSECNGYKDPLLDALIIFWHKCTKKKLNNFTKSFNHTALSVLSNLKSEKKTFSSNINSENPSYSSFPVPDLTKEEWNIFFKTCMIKYKTNKTLFKIKKVIKMMIKVRKNFQNQMN